MAKRKQQNTEPTPTNTSHKKLEPVASPTKAKTKMYRVLRGNHQDEDGNFCRRGNTFSSSQDMLKHNTPGSKKFELITSNVIEEIAEVEDDDNDGLNEMTLEELTSYAMEGDIDVSGCSTKEEIIKKLRESGAV